jgi:hypothetical protein
MIKKAVDLFLVYQFLKRLALPFTQWEAFKTGVIDEKGNIVTSKPERTPEQIQSFGKFDLMILKLKKLLAKVPGGSSKIASYMAALWLIKEWNHFSDKSALNESTSDADIERSANLFLEWYHYYLPIFTEDNRKITEEGEGGAPTVNVGGGDIAGLGVGPQGEPGLTRAQQKKHRKQAAATAMDMAGRKTFAAFVKEAASTQAASPTQPIGYAPEPTNIQRGRRDKRHPQPTDRIA